MHIKVKHIPNIITSLRIAGTFCLLFITPLSTEFFVVYTACGLTDVLDGAIARATKNVSQLGAKLDSVADLLYYAVMIIRIFPVLWALMPMEIWYCLGGVLVIRIASYIVNAAKGGGFASMHTVLNKASGLGVFGIPYTLGFSWTAVYCFSVVGIAAAASVQELIIHITQKKED